MNFFHTSLEFCAQWFCSRWVWWPQHLNHPQDSSLEATSATLEATSATSEATSASSSPPSARAPAPGRHQAPPPQAPLRARLHHPGQGHQGHQGHQGRERRAPLQTTAPWTLDTPCANTRQVSLIIIYKRLSQILISLILPFLDNIYTICISRAPLPPALPAPPCGS